ncbi:MAG: L-threonylcarbamoyladenylate synthase [Gammaproteobacteria bacterium]|nr:L-threonylcarbamoyladenylate synthase [Gammaproteobacteria bacterium]MDH3466487.1 L-threonylcarbamoyladenylate synthase [Gammaproteobacteria bacterium]
MAQYFQIHPRNPQLRLIRQAVGIIESGGVLAYPTDSSYALGCRFGNVQGAQRMRDIRMLDERHNFTLVCAALSDVGRYVKLRNEAYRFIRAFTPGPYTFIVPATREIPRRFQNQRRRTVGLRIPDSEIVNALLAELGAPLLSTTLIMPGDAQPQSDADQIRDMLEHKVELVIDGGVCGIEPTTVIDLVNHEPEVLRVGKGDIAMLKSNEAWAI